MKQRFIASGKAFGEFHAYREKIAVFCTPAMPTHAIRWADPRAEL